MKTAIKRVLFLPASFIALAGLLSCSAAAIRSDSFASGNDQTFITDGALDTPETPMTPSTSDETAPSGVSESDFVGTIIAKPTQPMNLTVFPDFDLIPVPEWTASAETSVQLDAPVGETSEGDDSWITSVLQVWESIRAAECGWPLSKTRGGVNGFGDLVSLAVAEADIAEITDKPVTVRIPATTLINTTATWEIQILREGAGYRFYFLNLDSGFIEASYVMRTDANGEPVTGLLSYVSPTDMIDSDFQGWRLFEMAFDFTDVTNLLSVTRGEKPNRKYGDRWTSWQFFQQCDKDGGVCANEAMAITSAPPLRQLGDIGNMRFLWNNPLDETCIAAVDEFGAVPLVGTTLLFDGNGKGEFTVGTCALPEVAWGGHLFTADDLPMREEDSLDGGRALELFVDGVSTTGWQTIGLDLIPGWLNGNGL